MTAASVLPSSPAQPESASVAGLWESFHAELLGYLKARGVASAEADDLLQTVFLRVHRQLQSSDEPRSPRAWLYQTLRHLVVDSARGESRRRELLGQVELGSADEEPELERETFQLVAASLPLFIDQLDEPYRSALQAVEMQGLTQAEAARQAGISLSGMKSRVQRGRQQLLVALKRCCEFELDGRGRVIACSPRKGGNCGC